MSFGDLSKRFRKAQQNQQDAAEQAGPYDYDESYRIRSKMLGVLIRDARVSAARTIDDCARLLHVTPQDIEAWEYGDAVPDLPQLELLAYYLDVHISHFWGQQTLQSNREAKVNTQAEYMQLRNRMIGALLRQAREALEMTVEQVAEQARIRVDALEQYEMGAQPIPMNHLPVLSNIVNKNMDYFLETSSYIGELLKIREEWKEFTDLDEEIREFAANPLNVGFIKIAITFSKMPVEQLRQAAEGMLNITM